jgi:hypothetical protein
MGNRRTRISSFFADLFEDDRGQGTVEYILILSVAVVAAGSIARKILESIDKGILRLGGQLEKDLKTGRAPVDIWQN